jgi:predicted ribosome quality control (RQC) complex YloA/Tae2 family protein
MSEYRYNGKDYRISVGKNKNHNFDLIDAAAATDLWFHVAGSPSAHVILDTQGEPRRAIPHAVLKHCARLCINTGHKGHKGIPVIYTEIAKVEKTAVIGQVQVRGTAYHIDVKT